jgi:hypothetical protein
MSRAFRAAGAFALAVVSVVPLGFMALLIGMASESRVVFRVTAPIFFGAQQAFPRDIERIESYATIPIHGALVMFAWLLCAAAFAFVDSRVRFSRLWVAAPIAVWAIIVVSHLALHATGFHVVLDGP